jgi:H+-transporting ATPase
LVLKYGKLIKRAGGFAQVFPQHKYLIVHALRGMGYKCGMTGDGVNDAPALKAADVGIAVSGSTDAARLAADIVLTRPGLYTIINGIIVAREIFARIYNFLTYRIAASLQLLVFFFLAVLLLSPSDYAGSVSPANKAEWTAEAEFKMPVLLLMLITLLNDGTLISIGYDNVVPSPYPAVWNLRVLFCVSIVLGAVACFSSLALLWACLDSWNPDGVIKKLGMAGDMNYGQITTIIYMKVSVSDFLTLFSSRGGEGWFWEIKPAPILIGAAFIALGLSTTLALAWPKGSLDNVPIEGLALGNHAMMALYTWIYAILCWFLQDALKVGTYKLLRSYSLLGIDDDFHMTDENLGDFIPSDQDHPVSRRSMSAVFVAGAHASHVDDTNTAEGGIRRLASSSLSRKPSVGGGARPVDRASRTSSIGSFYDTRAPSAHASLQT